MPTYHKEFEGIQDWVQNAACQDMDTDLFYPGRGEIVAAEAAKVVCRSCDVQVNCLNYALDQHIEEGIYGGASGRERRRIQRQRRLGHGAMAQ